MSGPRLWDPKLEYCPEIIRSHPQPFDQCSAHEPMRTPPGEHYRRFSFFADTAFNLGSTSFDRFGFGLILRPLDKTPLGFWGFGVQTEINFKKMWTALGRIQSSFNLQRNGRDRLTLAALGGLHHEAGIGTFPQFGIETALDFRLMKNGSQVTLTLPVVSARYTLAPSASANDRPDSAWTLLLGMRLSLDMFPAGQ